VRADVGYEPVRFLSGKHVTFETLGAEPGELAMHDGERRWEFVRAFRTHPMTDPERFIALKACEPGSTKEIEVGVLRDMGELAPGDRKLLEDALARRYLVQTIRRIRAIREEFGFMYWDVDTDRGERSLILPRWNQSHVVEMGQDGEGRIVIDVWGNRSLILDMEALDERSQRIFELFVHW
jgi:hypothetical protein